MARVNIKAPQVTKDTVSLSATVSVETCMAIDALVVKQKLSRSNVFRLALQEYVEKHKEE
jgi:hypothetical protein